MKKTQTKVSGIKTPHTTPKIIGKSLESVSSYFIVVVIVVDDLSVVE